MSLLQRPRPSPRFLTRPPVHHSSRLSSQISMTIRTPPPPPAESDVVDTYTLETETLSDQPKLEHFAWRDRNGREAGCMVEHPKGRKLFYDVGINQLASLQTKTTTPPTYAVDYPEVDVHSRPLETWLRPLPGGHLYDPHLPSHPELPHLTVDLLRQGMGRCRLSLPVDQKGERSCGGYHRPAALGATPVA